MSASPPTHPTPLFSNHSRLLAPPFSHTRHPTTGPLHWLLLLPRALFPQGVACSHTSFMSLLNWYLVSDAFPHYSLNPSEIFLHRTSDILYSYLFTSMVYNWAILTARRHCEMSLWSGLGGYSYWHLMHRGQGFCLTSCSTVTQSRMSIELG